ncbi:tandem-95 repeat protein, partial [Janthinobacterium aquaticum]|uniref:tandem-95 repeat protein n=1 Tax=Janthinobacterium sp. FT58W TaxID=2654254 RepID=UPI001264A964
MKNPDRTVIQASTTTNAPARRALKRRAPAPLVLEQRIMFDGAAVDTAVAARAAAEHAAADGATAERAAAEKQAVTTPAAVAAPAVAPARQEIVFIEDNVVNLQQLVAGVREGVEVVVLDHTRDGLQQMLAALQGHAPVDAIHLVTHGSSGQIELGSTISGANIEQYRDQFAQLGQSLTADGDLLIYGCDVAEGAAGQAFVDRLAALTQADVAASTDVTGSAAFHGNWTLETQHGAIETAAMALDRAGWQGELAVDTVYNANWQTLDFNGATSVSGSGSGRSTGDVMRFSNVITLSGQAIDAIVTTTVDRATFSVYDDASGKPSSETKFFQPNMNVTTAGGGVTFTIAFYKAGTYTGAGTGTAVTLQNVAINSYDIDTSSTSGTDRQYQVFSGFARYELSTATKLVPTVQADGSVIFLYTSNSPAPNDLIYDDGFRVKVYYDSLSSINVKSGVNGGTGTAYFALDFSVGPKWAGPTNIVDTPAAKLSYSTTNFVEATANDGSFTMTSTITLNNGGSNTFSGSDGSALSGVTFSNTPAGLTAEVTRTSATTAVLKFTGNATAHANANDISNFGVSFGNGAFSGVLASAVTGAARSDIVVDFADPAANNAPTASGTAFTIAEDTLKSGSLPSATDIDGDSITYSKGSDPAHGTVVVNANGTYLYTPTANYNGADSFTYKVTDTKGASNTYTVAITVSPVNDAPTASGTAISTAEDTTKSGSLPAATDVDGDTVTYSKGSDPAHGTVVVNSNGTYTYTPVANYNGADSFTYTVSDGNGGSNTYTVAVTVSPVNDAPTASGTAISTAEDTTKSGSLPAATDVDGDTVTYSKGSNPAHGTVVVNSNGTYTYTPVANYNGADSFTYTVSDGNGGSNTYTVAITVSPVNDAPTASGTAIGTAEDTAKSGNLPVASDVDGDTVTYSKGSDPAHGTVVVNSNGTYTYTPVANYNGADSFTYTVSDGNGGSNTYTVAITVSPVNDAPTASGTAIGTAEDTAKTGNLPVASDVDGDTVTYSKGSDPAHGTVVVNSNGTYTYTPVANYNGADSFTYTVSDGNGGSNTYTVAVTVSPVNDAPTASGTAIGTAEDTAKTGNLPVASDVDGDTVTYGKGSDPAHGTVVVNSNGTYTYTPVANYNGADSFTYTVSDGNGGSNTYTVAVTVSPVNDAPTASGTAIGTAEDTAKTGNLPVASDVDGDTVTYSKGSNPAHGTVVVNSNGTYTYTPVANYNGADSFTYTVSDGNGGSNTYTVAVTVSPVNDAPTAAGTAITTAEDTAKTGNLPVASDVDGDTVTYSKGSDPAHGTVVVNSNGTYTYTPVANYNGADSFTYTVSDGNGGSNTYTVAITVSPVNDAPVAGNDSVTLDEDTVKTGTLPAATDVDGDTVTYTKASDPAHGTVVVNANGSYTYTPVADYNGADSFTYTVSDGKGGSNTYVVNIVIDPVNDAPVGSGTTITTAEDTVKTGNLPPASDVDGDTVTYTKASDPSHGTVTVNPDGSYS